MNYALNNVIIIIIIILILKANTVLYLVKFTVL